jgi:hypothetical protein
MLQSTLRVLTFRAMSFVPQFCLQSLQAFLMLQSWASPQHSVQRLLYGNSCKLSNVVFDAELPHTIQGNVFCQQFCLQFP